MRRLIRACVVSKLHNCIIHALRIILHRFKWPSLLGNTKQTQDSVRKSHKTVVYSAIIFKANKKGQGKLIIRFSSTKEMEGRDFIFAFLGHPVKRYKKAKQHTWHELLCAKSCWHCFRSLSSNNSSTILQCVIKSVFSIQMLLKTFSISLCFIWSFF